MERQPKNFIPKEIMDEAMGDPRSAFGIMAENYLIHGKTNPSAQEIDMEKGAIASSTIHETNSRSWGENMIDGSEDPRIVAAERERAARKTLMKAGLVYNI